MGETIMTIKDEIVKLMLDREQLLAKIAMATEEPRARIKEIDRLVKAKLLEQKKLLLNIK